MGLLSFSVSSLPGVYIVNGSPFADARGAFERFFCARELGDILGSRTIVQINRSRTSRVGAIRGLHFQHPPAAEMKLVRCVNGRVLDVVVDLRNTSATFLKWFATELSASASRTLVVPEGCAHGFQVLEPDSELAYLHTNYYTPELEGGVRFDDPRLAITWPLPVTDVSDRDRNHPPITTDFAGIAL